ncbi:hypothetical protein DOTSEDRAFT_74732 [Dothistroma septosporum NZE10]|uniref:Uncharacterized protein n=1 Tax=Dothistroma septosporum (strain NZE10 / CBS 128990) TaxID=675120 RepID=N1PD01_DOTSN|nr:hypothetical protein DOTSEDRAFT_74732 [Dothistroma septosporum NZE10]
MKPNDASSPRKDSDASSSSSRRLGGRLPRARMGRIARSDAPSRPRELRSKALVNVVQQEENETKIDKSAPVPISRLGQPDLTAGVSQPAFYATHGLGPLGTSVHARHGTHHPTTRRAAISRVTEPAEPKGLKPTTQDLPQEMRRPAHRAAHITKEVSESAVSDDQTRTNSAAGREGRGVESPGDPWLQPEYQDPSPPHFTSPGKVPGEDDPAAPLSAWTRNPDDDLFNPFPPSLVISQGAEMSPMIYQDSHGKLYRKSTMERDGVLVDVARHEVYVFQTTE